MGTAGGPGASIRRVGGEKPPSLPLLLQASLHRRSRSSDLASNPVRSARSLVMLSDLLEAVSVAELLPRRPLCGSPQLSADFAYAPGPLRLENITRRSMERCRSPSGSFFESASWRSCGDLP